MRISKIWSLEDLVSYAGRWGNARDVIEYLRVHLRGILHFRNDERVSRDPLEAKLPAPKKSRRGRKVCGHSSALHIAPFCFFFFSFFSSRFLYISSPPSFFNMLTLLCSFRRRYQYRCTLTSFNLAAAHLWENLCIMTFYEALNTLFE